MTTATKRQSQLERGDVLVDGRVVFYVAKHQRGGVGMGEHPARWTVVLSTGELVSSDEWTDDPIVQVAGKVRLESEVIRT